jgi:hypothetical protein
MKKPSAYIDHVEYGIAALLTLAATALHLVLLFNVGDPWRDEVSAIAVASMPNWGAIWETIRYDSFPFLYYALLNAWMGIFGDSTTSIRMLGLTLGLGALGSTWWLASRLRIGSPLLLLAMVAMSATVVRYGDSARAYGLGLITAALMLGSIWTLLSNSSKKNISFAIFACMAAVHTTYQNSLLLFVIGSAAIVATSINRRWRSAVTIACICAVTAASVTIYLPTLSFMKSIAVMFQSSISITDVFIAFGETVSTGFENWQKWVWLAFSLLGLGGAFASLLVSDIQADATAQDDAITHSLFIALVVPLLGIVYTAFMIWGAYAVRPWYLLGLMVVLVSVLEAGIVKMPIPIAMKKLVRVIPALIIGALAVTNAPTELKRRATNMPDLIASIERSGGPNDLVILTEWYAGLTFNHLYPGNKEWMTIPDLGRNSVHRWDSLRIRMQDTSGVSREIEKIKNTLLAGHQVFVIGGFPRIPPNMAQVQLPPAPHPQAGWASGSYTRFWAAQTGFALLSNATRSFQLKTPDSRDTVMHWENYPLQVFSKAP